MLSKAGLCTGKLPALSTEYSARFGAAIATEYSALWGSFSAVSKPIFASKYSFYSMIFRDLQDLHSFAPFFFSEVGKPWKTHLKDLPNAAAFAAKAARQNQGAEKWKRENMRHGEKAALQERWLNNTGLPKLRKVNQN